MRCLVVVVGCGVEPEGMVLRVQIATDEPRFQAETQIAVDVAGLGTALNQLVKQRVAATLADAGITIQPADQYKMVPGSL